MSRVCVIWLLCPQVQLSGWRFRWPRVWCSLVSAGLDSGLRGLERAGLWFLPACLLLVDLQRLWEATGLQLLVLQMGRLTRERDGLLRAVGAVSRADLILASSALCSFLPVVLSCLPGEACRRPHFSTSCVTAASRNPGKQEKALTMGHTGGRVQSTGPGGEDTAAFSTAEPRRSLAVSPRRPLRASSAPRTGGQAILG